MDGSQHVHYTLEIFVMRSTDTSAAFPVDRQRRSPLTRSGYSSRARMDGFHETALYSKDDSIGQILSI